jgi:short-subunit dehydrogenase
MSPEARTTLLLSTALTGIVAKSVVGSRYRFRNKSVVSIGGKIGVPHLLPYVVSKFAQAGLSEGLGAELAREGIHITSVFHGLMRTGSHVNASFKGENCREFAWFSIAASMPLASMNAERAARQIVEACRAGRAELILTPPARMATLARVLFPAFVSFGLQFVNTLLPKSRKILRTRHIRVGKAAQPGPLRRSQSCRPRDYKKQRESSCPRTWTTVR